MADTPSLENYNSLFSQNITLSNQFNELISEYRNKNTSINDKIDEMEQEVNSIVNNAGTAIFKPREMFFDRETTYSKTSLNITADIKDNTQSNWVKVGGDGPQLRNIFSPEKLTIIHPVTLYSIAPGYYESVQYSNDTSRTYLQFIIAPYNATSDQINCEIESCNDTHDPLSSITSKGYWSEHYAYDAFNVHTIQIEGLTTLHQLFVRFKNIPYEDRPAQNITTFGGDSSFSLDKICNYPTISY